MIKTFSRRVKKIKCKFCKKEFLRKSKRNVFCSTQCSIKYFSRNRNKKKKKNEEERKGTYLYYLNNEIKKLKEKKEYKKAMELEKQAQKFIYIRDRYGD